MILSDAPKFENVNDPIKTEELIYNQLSGKDLSIPYVKLPLAFSINTLGLQKTQEFINRIEDNYSGKKIYVCQHIMVRNLNFYDNLIFTPHTEKNDKFNFIPHYNPIYSQKIDNKKISNRKFLMSFIGDFASHSTRSKLVRLRQPDVLVEPTNRWHFYLSPQQQEINKKRYKDVLEETKLSLCPRGTGPSTLRLFESLSIGAVPIIFNDLDLPEEIMTLIYKFDIKDIENEKFLENFKTQDIIERSNLLYDYYWNNLSNDNLSKSIQNKIQNL